MHKRGVQATGVVQRIDPSLEGRIFLREKPESGKWRIENELQLIYVI